MATREGRADRYNCAYDDLSAAERDSAASVAAFFCSKLRFEGLENYQPKSKSAARSTARYLAKLLYYNGTMAYDRITGMWLKYAGQGRLSYAGGYSSFRLYSQDGGASLYRSAKDIAIFDANPEKMGYADIIKRRARSLKEFDKTILQNVKAVRAMILLYVKNKQMQQKLVSAVDKWLQKGDAVTVIETGENKNSAENLFDDGTIQVLQASVPYLGTALIDDRRKIWDEMLHFAGVHTAPEKGERLITDEVAAFNDETSCYLEMTKDTFNICAEENGMDIRMSIADGAKKTEVNKEDGKSEVFETE